MHGTLEFFRKKRLKPKTISPHDAFDPRWIAPGDVVVFHGGGNFGDLYPCFQQLRERIVYTHGDNRIIVLPQSLHFSSDEKMESSARIFRTHGDVHLCVRDRASLQMASQFSDRVYLLPDMAHQLYPLHAHQLDGNGTLRISRVDDEAGDESVRLQDIDGTLRIDTLTDWPQFVGERERRIELFRRAYGGFFRRGMGRMTNRLLARMWIAYSGRLVADAAQLFARHKTIVTDRLHGHILACLLNRKNIVLDNSYGKNSRYVKAWTQPSGLVVLQEKHANVSADNVPDIAMPSHAAGRASMTRQRADIAPATV
jgi:pyruvyl transferase EpsO